MFKPDVSNEESKKLILLSFIDTVPKLKRE